MNNPWIIAPIVVVALVLMLVSVFGEKPEIMPDEHGESNEPSGSMDKKNSLDT